MMSGMILYILFPVALGRRESIRSALSTSVHFVRLFLGPLTMHRSRTYVCDKASEALYILVFVCLPVSVRVCNLPLIAKELESGRLVPLEFNAACERMGSEWSDGWRCHLC